MKRSKYFSNREVSNRKVVWREVNTWRNKENATVIRIFKSDGEANCENYRGIFLFGGRSTGNL